MNKLVKIKNILQAIQVLTLIFGCLGMDGVIYMDNPISPIIVLFTISAIAGVGAYLVGKEIECEEIRENNRRLFIARHSNSLQRYCR